jgi:hypothetical protein
METKMPHQLGPLITRMKWIACVFLPSPISAATAQVKTGTVLYVDLPKDEFTVAADSRPIFLGGNCDDTECKILAFGSQFVFSMAGMRADELDHPVLPAALSPQNRDATWEVVC